MINFLLVTGLHGTLSSLFRRQPSLSRGLDAGTTWFLSMLPLYFLAKAKFIPGRLILSRG